MNIIIELNEKRDEVIEDWTKVRLVMEKAAEALGLKLDQLIHKKGPMG